MTALSATGEDVQRVLVLAPEGRNAQVVAQILSGSGIHPYICAGMPELIGNLDQAEAVFATEECLERDLPLLTNWLTRQPPWSDLPFVVLVARRHGQRASAALKALMGLGNIVLLERPLNAETLVTAARSARRARARQYQARRQLMAEAELRDKERQARTDAAEAGQALAVAVDAGELGTFHCPLPFLEFNCSPRCREHLGLPPREPVTLHSLLKEVHADDRVGVMNAFFHESLDTDSREIEWRTVATNGAVRWVRAKGRIYRRGDGQMARFDGVTLDVTAQKQLEAERETLLEAEREARREAERAGRMKDEFIATLSHELRTPLSAIVGWANILQRAGTAANVSKAADTIERNARAQAQLIDDLLDLSRIASGNIRLVREPVSLTSVIDGVQQMLRPSYEAKQIALTLDPASWPGVIQADARRVQQIIWNIVANAVKFTPAGGTVQIRVDRDTVDAIVTVSDSGIGIPADFMPHVFDRFRQAEASEARSYGGLGLGLAIVRQLVEMQGGSVQASSAGPDQGATFSVRLPLGDQNGMAQGLAAAPAASPGASASMALDAVRVLVVDDEDDGRDMLATLLRSHGASVSTAESAAAALALLANRAFDVLISDIGMPTTDGYQFLRGIRASQDPWHEVPAIALTAFARSEDASKAHGAGFDAHLAKPVEPARLVAAIESLLQAHGSLKRESL